jgi:hypothetical protein
VEKILKSHTRTTLSVVLVLTIVFTCVFSLAAGSPAAPSSDDAKSTQKPSASSIQIQPIDPGDVPIPPDFRVAVYENLITQIQKTGKFQHVYRSGDKDAASAPDLVTLSMVTQSFNKGSQKKREVTTVSGSSQITLKVHITDHAGKTVVDRDVQGKVRFFGENLRVTYDFSKKVAKIVNDTF